MRRTRKREHATAQADAIQEGATDECATKALHGHPSDVFLSRMECMIATNGRKRRK
jgi:hypothetical protein